MRGASCPKEGETVKSYEVVYIFDSKLEEPEVNQKLDRYHELVAGEGVGEVEAVDHWGRRQLAYPIQDHENGYYVVTHLNTSADKLPEFERILGLDEGLLRYLVVINEGNLATTPAPIVEPKEDDEDSDEMEA
jgi:small subunit ribosomal protein S6